MRIVLQLILLWSFIPSFGQTPKTTVIKISIFDCRKNDQPHPRGADTILLYKLPEDTIVSKIIHRKFVTYPIRLENMTISAYRMTYRNNYDQLVSKELYLQEQPVNSIVICPDILLEYSQNTLIKLQNKDSIVINFRSYGCFHFENLKLTITKENDALEARLYQILESVKTKGRKTKIKYQGRVLIKSSTLTPANIADFVRFENELNHIKKRGGCTTTDLYSIESKYLNMERQDGRCRWNGFYYLKKSFFGEDKER